MLHCYQVKTVRKWVTRFQQDGNIQRKFGPGRPRITTNEQNLSMVEYLKENPFSSAVRAAALENVPYSTAVRRIHESGLSNFAAAHETKLTEEHKRQRIIYSHYMLDVFGEQNFDKIIFTDEKTFMSDEIRHVRVWRPKKERYKQIHVCKDSISGHISAGYWGWMGIGGPGEIVEIDGHFNQDKYLEILEEVFLPSVEAQYGGIENIFFMQDNSPIHTARRVKQFLLSKHIPMLNHPPMSPDLNLIEHVWAMMERDRPEIIQRTHDGLNEHVFSRWESLRGRQGKFSFQSMRIRSPITCSYRNNEFRIISQPFSIVTQSTIRT